MSAGDWLQGPYVYFLYTTYGFGKGEIGQLFIAGFGSSMLFGTIVGSLADKQWVFPRELLFYDNVFPLLSVICLASCQGSKEGLCDLLHYLYTELHH